MLSLHGDELAIPFDFIAPSPDVMLENLNNSLFYFINATPDSAQWTISLAIFIAKDVINIVPLLAVVLWLWGPRDRVCAQRQLIVKIGIALIISLAVSGQWDTFSRTTVRLSIISAITSCIMPPMTRSPAITVR